MKFSLFAILALLLVSTGCSTPKSDFVPKTEEQLASMENLNKIAHGEFVKGNYAVASAILAKINTERTVSRPLYQLEELSVLLMDGQEEKALELMKKLHEDFETLFDEKLEEKAASLWHGEINKVFKGDSYERSTFYALMALSFLNSGNYEDALRAVKNGLLADADSTAETAVDDYPLLHYLGFFAAKKMQDEETAQFFMRAMKNALKLRGFKEREDEKNEDNCYSALAEQNPNVMLVVWAGAPPTVVRSGEYNEIRNIIRGYNAFDSLAVAVNSDSAHFVPNYLGDVEFQATTRGGRLMDTVLADQAAAKSVLKTSGSVLMIVGPAIFYAGLRNLGTLPVGITLMSVGGGCVIVGGIAHLVGAMINPEADSRFWRNLPAQLYIVPLTLPAGRHQVMIQGYRNSDAAGITMYNIDVKDKTGMNVIHLPMMSQGFQYKQAMRNCHRELRLSTVRKADADRMAKEIK